MNSRIDVHTLRNAIANVTNEYLANVNPRTNSQRLWSQHGYRGRRRAIELLGDVSTTPFHGGVINAIKKLPSCTLQRMVDAQLKSLFDVRDFETTTLVWGVTPIAPIYIDPNNSPYYHSSREKLYDVCVDRIKLSGQQVYGPKVYCIDRVEEQIDPRSLPPATGPISKC